MKIIIKIVDPGISLLPLTISLVTYNDLSIVEVVLSKHIDRIRMFSNVGFWIWHSFKCWLAGYQHEVGPNNSNVTAFSPSLSFYKDNIWWGRASGGPVSPNHCRWWKLLRCFNVVVQLPVHCSGSCRRCQLKFWFFKQHSWHSFIFPVFLVL